MASYLFIDGGYLRKRFEVLIGQVYQDDPEIDFCRIKKTFACQRVFYYDCAADDVSSNSNASGLIQYCQTSEKFFETISDIPGYHLRLGSLSGHEKRGKRQKEVDVLLAVDMLTHSFSKNMSTAVLLGGDLDFKPIVDALVRLGTYVTVACERRSASQKLIRAADEWSKLEAHSFWVWSAAAFQQRHKRPEVKVGATVPQSPPYFRKRVATSGARQVTLYSTAQGSLELFMPAYEGTRALSIKSEDENLLLRYFAALTGISPHWQTPD